MSNNIIVITGASSGMGREFAMQLDRGLSSVDEFWLVARRIGRMKEMAEKMRHRVKILPLDLTNEGDLDILKESLLEEKPAVRMLINCAGYGMMGDVEQIPQKEQAGQVDLNCRALVEPDYPACQQRGVSAPAGLCGICGDQILCAELF